MRRKEEEEETEETEEEGGCATLVCIFLFTVLYRVIHATLPFLKSLTSCMFSALFSFVFSI